MVEIKGDLDEMAQAFSKFIVQWYKGLKEEGGLASAEDINFTEQIKYITYYT